MKKRAIALLASLAVLFAAIVVVTTPTVARAAQNDAADMVTLEFDGYVDTQAGRELLVLVNKAREAEGVDPLVWDAELEQIAMQRAAESAIRYAHIRPDGTDCFTAWPSWSMYAGENLAAGYATAEEANTAWTNSAGHYANMVGVVYESFAAAVYVGTDGSQFWVECFSSSTSDSGWGTAFMGNFTCDIRFDISKYSLSWPSYVRTSVMVGDSYQLDMPMVGLADTTGAGLVWSSSDTSVLKVSSMGVVTGVSAGTATITVAAASNPACNTTLSFTVKPKEADTFDIATATVADIPKQVFSGGAIEPALTVTLGGRTLVEGTDYYVKWYFNDQIGIASVHIRGMDNYTGSKMVHFYILSPVGPIFSLHPSEYMGVAGKTMTFSVAAVAETSVSYRWQVSTDGGVTWANVGSSVSGYNTANLSMMAARGLDGYMFRCAATDANGDTTYSRTALVTITPDGYTAIGTWGECEWDVSDAGVLTVHPGKGADTGALTSGVFAAYADRITSVVFAEEGGKKVVAPYVCANLLRGLYNVVSVDLSGLDTSGAAYLYNLFEDCSSIKSLDLTSLDVSKAKRMDFMFEGCTSLTSLNMRGWDTSNVEDMAGMFSNCTSLVTLDVSVLDTSKVTDMRNMFDSSSSLVSLDLSTFDTSRVTLIYDMFYGCRALESLDLSSFETSNVTYATGMFSYCTSLANVVVGRGMTSIVLSELPEYEVNGYEEWYSTAAKAWFTADEIAESRAGIADTYTKSSGPRIDISGAKVTAPAQTYKGWALEPDVTVVLGGVTLEEGVHFTVEYADNVDAGTATIIVTGKRDYCGTARGTFVIEPRSIEDLTVTAYDQDYTGDTLTPTVRLYWDGARLEEGVDFTVSYANNVNAGTATITATGMGNFTGTTTGTFTIEPIWIYDAVVTAADQVWTGSPLTPPVKVTLDGRTIAASDYDLSYHYNTAVGTAYIKVVGKNNFKGTIWGTFEITAAPVVKTGWQQVDGTWYFYGSNGKPMTNHWEKYAGKWYFFGADGKLVITGWATYQGKYYYYRGASLVKSGWVLDGESYYYLQNYSPVMNKWVQYGGAWYHFGATGVCDDVWKG